MTNASGPGHGRPDPGLDAIMSERRLLTAVKDAYDPDNVFHLNHNIAPSGH